MRLLVEGSSCKEQSAYKVLRACRCFKDSPPVALNTCALPALRSHHPTRSDKIELINLCCSLPGTSKAFPNFREQPLAPWAFSLFEPRPQGFSSTMSLLYRPVDGTRILEVGTYRADSARPTGLARLCVSSHSCNVDYYDRFGADHPSVMSRR